MSQIVKCGLIQAKNCADSDNDIATIKSKNLEKHLRMIKDAVEMEAQIVCLQELFYGPYFPAEQDKRWYAMAEPLPQGKTIQTMVEVAQKYKIVLIAPIMEEALPGLYYNTAVVIDADGTILGKYRKHHLPQLYPGFWEHFYFRPGDGGYPVFDTTYAKIGVYICYDRHFPEGARILGLNGAQIVFNPSATVKGLALHLWELEMPANAVANGYFVGAINRVGIEEPWKTGEFFGSSYFCDPRGKIIAQGSASEDDIVVAELDWDLIRQIREEWQFFRDRRTDSYQPIVS
jgi:N-carbamoylputrescine amidase